ncbi:Phosphate ABC transporter, periplasmic phosphate-binding protein PstS (TC 3.A.1.7.1) [hydrothermal vent metagenome]|uniref:Phosphate ABC transporter, periplasmic phosphate-binding protein PstS (TC 3.A.1.7.1) n=1 Tax=hydrothermal vent metagenome TaxID=652676 RepID=A0A3B1BC71_9ZZZZ
MRHSKVYFLLMVLFVCPELQADELRWAGCGITKKAFMAELAKAYTNKTGIKVEINGGGATRGIRDAANGKIDIGGACRMTIEGNKLEANAYQIPVAWDALVVIVNKDNPVTDISFEQLQGIYLGKIKNWKVLGGNDEPIELYVRRGKLSGVGRTLRELVFANFNQEFVATHKVKSSGPLEKGVMKNIRGLGVTGISSAKRRDVKILKLDGKYPDYKNISKGDYALYRPLYLVINRNNRDKKVHEFIKYALSREGQTLIREQGTVPYSEAMGLVMKQLEQYQRASQRGLYQ